jgi:hypothetical protein
VCENGPTLQLVEQLKPLLEKYRVSAYVSGHDHCQVHVDEGTGVQYHVSGGGHDLSDSTASEGDVPPGSLKFHYGAPPSAKATAKGNDNLGAFASATFVRVPFCFAKLAAAADAHAFCGCVLMRRCGHQTSEGMVFSHFDSAGTMLYTAPAIKPRTATVR